MIGILLCILSIGAVSADAENGTTIKTDGILQPPKAKDEPLLFDGLIYNLKEKGEKWLKDEIEATALNFGLDVLSNVPYVGSLLNYFRGNGSSALEAQTEEILKAITRAENKILDALKKNLIDTYGYTVALDHLAQYEALIKLADSYRWERRAIIEYSWHDARDVYRDSVRAVEFLKLETSGPIARLPYERYQIYLNAVAIEIAFGKESYWLEIFAEELKLANDDENVAWVNFQKYYDHEKFKNAYLIGGPALIKDAFEYIAQLDANGGWRNASDSRFTPLVVCEKGLCYNIDEKPYYIPFGAIPNLICGPGGVGNVPNCGIAGYFHMIGEPFPVESDNLKMEYETTEWPTDTPGQTTTFYWCGNGKNENWWEGECAKDINAIIKEHKEIAYIKYLQGAFEPSIRIMKGWSKLAGIERPVLKAEKDLNKFYARYRWVISDKNYVLQESFDAPSDIVVKAGASLTLTNGANINLHNTRRLIVETGGKLILQNGTVNGSNGSNNDSIEYDHPIVPVGFHSWIASFPSGGMDHFYTASNSKGTRDFLSWFGYRYQGVEGYVYLKPAPGTVGLHRWVASYPSKEGWDHFYTTDNSENARNFLMFFGYRDEGVEGYVYPEQAAETVGLHEWLKSFPTGGVDHLYTIHNNENTRFMLSNFFGYEYQKTVGYVYEHSPLD